MSIKGAGVSFSLEEEVHPAIINKAVNETKSSRYFFIQFIFVIPKLNNDVANVNFFLTRINDFTRRSQYHIYNWSGRLAIQNSYKTKPAYLTDEQASFLLL